MRVTQQIEEMPERHDDCHVRGTAGLSVNPGAGSNIARQAKDQTLQMLSMIAIILLSKV